MQLKNKKENALQFHFLCHKSVLIIRPKTPCVDTFLNKDLERKEIHYDTAEELSVNCISRKKRTHGCYETKVKAK